MEGDDPHATTANRLFAQAVRHTAPHPRVVDDDPANGPILLGEPTQLAGDLLRVAPLHVPHPAADPTLPAVHDRAVPAEASLRRHLVRHPRCHALGCTAPYQVAGNAGAFWCLARRLRPVSTASTPRARQSSIASAWW